MTKREKAKAEKAIAQIGETTRALYRAAIRETWQAIGSDVQAAASEAGEELESVGVSEAALDYVYQYGGLKGSDRTNFEGLDYDVRRLLALEALEGYV